MDRILVEGGNPLKGEVKTSGSKNAALPILMSSLLTDGWCTYSNVPALKDIESTLLLLEHLGAEVERNKHAIRMNASNVKNHEAPYELVRKMRASVLVLGPLVARLKKARVSLPGGCAIGARPINLHLKGLASLGADIDLKEGYVEASAGTLKGAEIYFDTITVTGTENLMMAAALADGVTTLRNTAREPEIVALADVLNKMGANIKGAGTSVITIEGVPSLSPVETEIIPDRIETGTFMVAAALTKGDIQIVNCQPDHVKGIINKMKQTGTIIKTGNESIHVKGVDEILSSDVKTVPYPGFPTDMQAQLMVLMSVAKGLSIIFKDGF
jgi:UDP-N-acetylglucosamine 1-carboxyvinyltransferase